MTLQIRLGNQEVVAILDAHIKTTLGTDIDVAAVMFDGDGVRLVLSRAAASPAPTEEATTSRNGHTLTSEEAADILGVCTGSVSRWARNGLLRGKKERGRWWLDPEDLRLFKDTDRFEKAVNHGPGKAAKGMGR